MPLKNKTVYICSQCGFESPKWYGKCSSCGEWNTMQEEILQKKAASNIQRKSTSAVQPIKDINPEGEKPAWESLTVC